MKMRPTLLLAACIALTASMAIAQQAPKNISGDILTDDIDIHSRNSAEVCWSNSDNQTCHTLVGAGNDRNCTDSTLLRTAETFMNRKFRYSNTDRLMDEDGNLEIQGVGGLRSFLKRDRDGSIFAALLRCTRNGEFTGTYALLIDLEDTMTNEGTFKPEGLFHVAIDTGDDDMEQVEHAPATVEDEPMVTEKPVVATQEEQLPAKPSAKAGLAKQVESLSEEDAKAIAKAIQEIRDKKQ